MSSVARILLLAAFSSWLAPRASAATENAANGKDDILLGMSTALGGPAANVASQMKAGVLAGLERANRAGGVNGRYLRLIALDDGCDPGRSAANVRRLIQEENVLAVIGDVGAATAAAPVCDERHVLFFAPFSGATALRPSPPDRYVVNYRASYAEETGAMIDALLDGAGLQPEDIAFFTERDAAGDASFEGGIVALRGHGLEDESRVLHVQYEPNTLAVENALATLLYADHEPRAIILAGADRPCAKFIKLAYDAGLRSLFLNVPFAGSDSLAAELANVPAKVLVTQVVPYPLAADVPMVRQYQADLKALDPAAKPGFTSLEGYVSCRILLEALQNIPGTPTRQGVIDALDALGEFDLGLGAKLHYGPDDHQACHRIWPTIVRNGLLVPFDWKSIGDLMRKDAQ